VVRVRLVLLRIFGRFDYLFDSIVSFGTCQVMYLPGTLEAFGDNVVTVVNGIASKLNRGIRTEE
jgi:hypothetical protein